MESIFLVILTILACAIIAKLVLKKYHSVFVFFASGIIIIIAASYITGSSAMGDASSGNYVVDAFAFITKTFKDNISGVGTIIMAVTGYGAYMKHINASTKLAFLAVKPLRRIKNKYIVLTGMFVVGIALKLVITSQAGLSLLLLGTTFPIMLALGIHPMIAASVMSLVGCLDYGPNDGSTIFAAQVAKMPVAQLFANHQLIVAVCIIVVLAIIIPFYYHHIDKKYQFSQTTLEHPVEVEDVECPKFYIVLPLVPLILVLLFSIWPVVPMDVVTANFIGFTFVFIIEFIRRKDRRAIPSDMKVILRSMADIFVNVISIIIAASVFAQGIKMLGGVSIIANAISNMQGAAVLTLILMSLITFGAATLMGSGAASWFAFGPLVPQIAAKLGIPATAMIVPMELGAAIGRSLSPVAGAIIAISGYAKVDLMKMVKITSIPLFIAMAVNIIASIITGLM